MEKTALWQAAIEALVLIATRGGPTMLARIGVMRARPRVQSGPQRRALGKAEAGRIACFLCPRCNNSFVPLREQKF
jgi:hypothetical protein